MDYAMEAIGGLLMLLLAIISYFLRILHRDVKENIKNTSENTANIKLLQQKSDDKLDRLAEITELQIQQLTDSVKMLNKTVSHMNGNMKNTDTVLGMMMEKFDLK